MRYWGFQSSHDNVRLDIWNSKRVQSFPLVSRFSHMAQRTQCLQVVVVVGSVAKQRDSMVNLKQILVKSVVTHVTPTGLASGNGVSALRGKAPAFGFLA